jgi:hypothetical protein
MSDESLKDILARASVLAGQDLGEVYENSRSRTEEIRSQLPKKARRIFDRELHNQKESKADRRQREAIVNKKANRRQLAKLDKLLKDRDIENPYPNQIPAHLWKQCRHIIFDWTGWACHFYSRLCWHKIGVGLAHRAALCYDEDGKARYSYIGQSREAIRARSILAIALLFFGLSRPTGRKKQGWSRIIKAIPQEAFLAAIANPSGKVPHRNTFDGTHRPSADDYTGGSVGYLIALVRAGVVYTRQAKWRPGDDPSQLKGWEDIKPEEMAGFVHPSGWCTSTVRYWIVADLYTDPVDAAKRSRLWLAWLAGCIPWQQDENGAFVPCGGQDSHVSPPPKPPD